MGADTWGVGGLLGVLAAAVAGFALGAAWYMALSKPWMEAAGLRAGPDGRPAMAASPTPFIISFLANLLAAGMMRHLFATGGIESVGEGLLTGLGIGALFILPWIAMNNAYTMRPARLTLIDGGYAVLAGGIIGLVLTLL